MLIRTQKDLHEYEKQAGKQLQCAFCEQPVGVPPALMIANYIYHVKCAMQLVYGVLEALSGYGPDIAIPVESHSSESLSSMAEAFRAAAQQRPTP